MKVLDIEPRPIDYKEYVKRSAYEADYEHLIAEDTLIKINGVPSILYKKLDFSLDALRRTLGLIDYQTTIRSNGLKTTSRVFGYQPRIAMRRDYCTATTLAADEPDKNEVVCDYGRKIAEIYKTHFPHLVEKHQHWVEEKVRPEWKISNSPFTSGIINKNNPLKYHFDAGNIKGVCSCMIGLKRSVGGGHLAVPELNIGLEIADGTLSIFDGQSILHGVTPIRRMSADAYRYTVVYYTLHQMWKCEPLDLELARIRNVKTERERKRAAQEESEVVETQHGTEVGKAVE